MSIITKGLGLSQDYFKVQVTPSLMNVNDITIETLVQPSYNLTVQVSSVNLDITTEDINSTVASETEALQIRTE